MIDFKVSISRLGFLCLSSFLFFIPALYNQFPLVYSDTGTYLLSGFENWLPNDRPIFYGWFIAITSLGYWSIWWPIFVQAFLLSFALNSLLSIFYTYHYRLLAVLALPFSLLGTGWYTSQLMPDIFIAIGGLSLVYLGLSKDWKTLNAYLNIGVLFLASLLHLSHFLVFLLCGILLLIAFKKMELIKRVALFAIPILAALCIATSNYVYKGSFQLSNGSHLFLTAKLIDSGLMQDFLNETCADNNHVLCLYQDELPKDSRAFLWGSDSPLNQTGGWENSKEAYSKMLNHFFKDFRFMTGFVLDVLVSGASQLTQISAGSGLVSDWYQSLDSPPYQAIQKVFPHELNPYLQSRQNTNLWKQGLDFTLINAFNYGLMVISLFWFLYLWFFQREQLKPYRLLIILILILIISNALVTGGLANVYDRLQARVSWLFLVLVFIVSKPYLAPPRGRINL